MLYDRDTCYAAIKSRDARFDGLFFTAVLTTGIFCRPTCPAVTPKLKNVQFYPTAAAATEAGFRPCLRCRPELSPEAAGWHGSSAMVSRALRLMTEDMSNGEGISVLAQSLNISQRQLRRSFIAELGASPVAILQTRRLLLAKKLIDETSLPMTEVAFGAGYSSIRRFNHALREAYGKPPTELRKNKVMSSQPENGLELKLFYRLPYHWEAIANFLRVRATPGVEVVSDTCYRRTVSFGENTGMIEIEYLPKERYLLLRIPHTLSRHLREIIGRITRLFDLQATPLPIAGHLAKDRRLSPLIDAYPGLRLPGAWEPFEIAVRAVVGQQISVAAATTLCGRLAAAYGRPLPEGAPGLSMLFPSPEKLIDAQMTETGIIARRAEAIRALAAAVIAGRLKAPASLDELIQELISIRGIGPWTANYIAMRVFNEPDAFPAGDLVLRRMASDDKDGPLTESQLLREAERWRPWRSYAAMYLWAKAGNKKI